MRGAAVSCIWCHYRVRYCSLLHLVPLSCAVLQFPAFGATIVCGIVVSYNLGYCRVRYCSPLRLVIVPCAVLQSPAFGASVVCDTAVCCVWCYNRVQYCSLLCLVLLLCAILQSHAFGATVMCGTAVFCICNIAIFAATVVCNTAVSCFCYYCRVRYCSLLRLVLSFAPCAVRQSLNCVLGGGYLLLHLFANGKKRWRQIWHNCSGIDYAGIV